MMRLPRPLALLAFALTATAVAAQGREPMAKPYEDVRFKIFYMDWKKDQGAAEPYRHTGPAVMVFVDDGALQTSAFSPAQHHAPGDVVYLEPGSVANGGMLAHGSSSDMAAVIVELKNVGSSRGLQASDFAPAFPRAGATRVLENDRVIVWDVRYRGGEQSPIMLHEKNSVQVWVDGANVEHAYPNQAPHVVKRPTGTWEMDKAGMAMSEKADVNARAISIELK